MNYAALTRCALFKGIDAKDLPAALTCLGAKTNTFAAGAYLLREGDEAGHIGVVLAGCAQVVREDAAGNRTVQAILQPGDLFAETFAAARLAHLPVSVLAATECEALFFPYASLVAGDGQCGHHTTLVQNLLGVLAGKNLALNARLGHLAHRTLRGKLASYLTAVRDTAGCNSFTIPLDRQGLADYLCADRSAVSAELGRMKRDGLVDYRRSHFTLYI